MIRLRHWYQDYQHNTKRRCTVKVLCLIHANIPKTHTWWHHRSGRDSKRETFSKPNWEYIKVKCFKLKTFIQTNIPIEIFQFHIHAYKVFQNCLLYPDMIKFLQWTQTVRRKLRNPISYYLLLTLLITIGTPIDLFWLESSKLPTLLWAATSDLRPFSIVKTSDKRPLKAGSIVLCSSLNLESLCRFQLPPNSFQFHN